MRPEFDRAEISSAAPWLGPATARFDAAANLTGPVSMLRYACGHVPANKTTTPGPSRGGSRPSIDQQHRRPPGACAEPAQGFLAGPGEGGRTGCRACGLSATDTLLGSNVGEAGVV
jgi:hypothetical protein